MFSPVVHNEISDLAQEYDFEPAAILAIAAVESAGVPFWQVDGKNVPPMRFEGHYFHRFLQGRKLEKAVSAGLAHPRAGGVCNPSSWSARYALLDRAIAIDEEAALMSCSWGLGQVMGSHYATLGFASPQAMVSTANTGVTGQVELMIRFIDHNGLRTHIDARNWAGFARRYNGSGYRKNRYDVKMANAYARYTGKAKRLNSRMAEIQRDLHVLGFDPGPVDGIAGKKTKAAILNFQADNGLVSDGLVGTITQEAIDAALTVQWDKKTANRRSPIAVGFGALAASFLIAAYDQVLSFFSWIGEVIL
ncbi:MAG: N-acetylmuramidase domain-containing protein [Stappiaceae bacterium]